MARKFTLFFTLFTALCLLTSGCAQNSVLLEDEPGVTHSKKVYRGKVRGKSRKAGTLSIEIVRDGMPRTIKINIDHKTRGLDHALRGKQVIVTCKVDKGRTVATSIRPELGGFVSGVSAITVEKVRKMIADRDDFVLIDSRSKLQYSRSHLPSAISIPSCAMRDRLDLLPEKKGRLLVFYCGGPSCGQSTLASATAAHAGYKNIKVMLAGIAGWAEAGYPTYADDDLVIDGDIVLIDLRPARKDTVQRIAGSVSIPFASLADRMDNISKKAPIIVYSDNISESLAALDSFRSAGFTTVSMVEGNFQGWKERNRAITSGPVVTEIKWKRKTTRNEVTPAAFEHAVNGRGGAVLLDVRTRAETAAGSLRYAKLIPLNELHERSAELPQDKKIYIYSATGARAKMAAALLRKKGFAAYFLVADISCQDGTCNTEF